MGSLIIKMPIMSGTRKGDVLTMPCGPRSTFGDVHMFLQDKLGKKTLSVYLNDHGEQNLTDTTLSSKTLRESMCLGSPIPVFFDEPSKGFPVYVKTLTGKMLAITVNKAYCVEDLKGRIWDKEGIPNDQQRLIYAGKQLENDSKLHRYGIHQDSVLHLVLRLRGGGFLPESFSMVDVSNDEARVDHAWSKTAPEWRGAAKGLTIEGTCENIECKAYGESVICNMRFGCFSMNTVVPNCPMCHYMVDCENIGFNNCFYKIRGIKEERNEAVSMPWTKVGDCYRTWDEDEAGVVMWEHMEIIVRELHTAKAVPGLRNKEAPVAEKCAICFNYLLGHRDALMLGCCHSYHEGCWEGWSDISRSRGCEITCPLCRAVVHET